MVDSGAGVQGDVESALGGVLEALFSLSGEVEAGYVVSGEGEVLASKGDRKSEESQAGVMISTLSSLSDRRARDRGHDGYSQVRVRAPEGYVLLTSLSDGSTLAATTGPEARGGLVLYDMRNARPEAERALSGESGTKTGGDVG